MLFSTRNGFTQIRQALKPSAITTELRNSLWNIAVHWSNGRDLEAICLAFWQDFFKLPIDEIPSNRGYDHRDYRPAWEVIRKQFFSGKWYEVYDLIEFLLSLEPHNRSLENAFNGALKDELSAYKLLGNQFVQITDESEIASLEEGLALLGKFSSVSKHIQTSIDLLSNRTNPDYRNSIKEAISAVESMAKIITGKSSASLDEALTALDRKHNLHAALKKGYLALYGYTSNANGIRHGLLEEANLTQADAKYFLISCTSFVNYLKSKLDN